MRAAFFSKPGFFRSLFIRAAAASMRGFRVFGSHAGSKSPLRYAFSITYSAKSSLFCCLDSFVAAASSTDTKVHPLRA
jgi:hypothetical protein